MPIYLYTQPSTFWIKWSMIEASLKNQRGYSADLYCCQQLSNCCCHSMVSSRSDLWPLTSARYFPSTQPPLIGYFLFSWTILCEPQKWLWCRENPTRSAFGDTQTCSPVWHQQQCSPRSKWLKSPLPTHGWRWLWTQPYAWMHCCCRAISAIPIFVHI